MPLPGWRVETAMRWSLHCRPISEKSAGIDRTRQPDEPRLLPTMSKKMRGPKRRTDEKLLHSCSFSKLFFGVLIYLFFLSAFAAEVRAVSFDGREYLSL